MDESHLKQNNLVDTTDCLEAVGVFRCWKNFLFVIILLCLLLLQACFWVVDTGFMKKAGEGTDKAVVETPIEEETQNAAAQPEAANPEQNVAQEQETQEVETGGEEVVAPITTDTEQIAAAAREVVGDANAAEQKSEQEETGKRVRMPLLKPTASQVASTVRFLNFILVPVAVLYCLTMLFSLKISLVGRLGGINHIARAFFLSLILLVLLLPWQLLFPGLTKGAMFTSTELLSRCVGSAENNIFCAILYYLRFVGYWILILLLLVMAQGRNSRWARTILKRLEVI